MSIIQRIVAEIRSLLHFKPGHPVHEEAVANIEKIKTEVTPEEAQEIDATVASAVATHATASEAPAAQEAAPAEQEPAK